MKFKKSLIYICAGALMFTGCKKDLDLSDPNSFTDENAFRTIQDVQLGVNAAYGRYNAYANDMFVNTLLSDEAKLGPGNAGFGALSYRYQYTADATVGGDVTAAYAAYYSLIDQVNRVLPKIATVTATPAEEHRRNILKGELLALRAIAHFSLLEFYADRYDPAKPGVPLMLTSNVTGKPARNTMGEVMLQIEKDLEDAKALLPATTAGNFSDEVMNSLNITAYQARIALYKRDYQRAIDFATEVINSGIRPLATGTDFQGIWTDAILNQEVLFRRKYVTGAVIGSLWTSTIGGIEIAPSDKLYATYAANDIRRTIYFATNANGDRYVNKFFESAKGARVLDIKAIRIAEMYLIRAEAYSRLAAPNITAGAADLNALRAARIIGYTPQNFASADDLFNAVMEERYKELAYEGFRWFDLKRNNLPVERAATDANPLWQTLPVNDYRWLLPIPRQEIIANPNTAQNPNY